MVDNNAILQTHNTQTLEANRDLPAQQTPVLKSDFDAVIFLSSYSSQSYSLQPHRGLCRAKQSEHTDWKINPIPLQLLL